MATSRTEIPIIKLINAELTSDAVNAHSLTARATVETIKGMYIKCSGIDVSKLFLVLDKSSKTTAAGGGEIYIRGASGCATLAGMDLPLVTDTYGFTRRSKGDKHFHIASDTGSTHLQTFLMGPFESARFKTPKNEYIMVDGSSHLGSYGGATYWARIRAIVLP